jgi:3',5'-nucleoside bisphosphate phosphatase
MEIYVDLHIHTSLSPCADNDMTPNNIVNMAKIKGLDAIAITDHNSCENVCACMKVGKTADIIVIPGMELQTKEEIHLLCLFKDLNSALEFQEYVYNHFPYIENVVDIFGQQLIIDSSDNIIGHKRSLLLSSADISLDDAITNVQRLGGICIPAHVDREAYSIINNLGFIPDYLNIRTIEVSKKYSGEYGRFKTIRDSDAHYLFDILERETCLNVPSKSIQEILKSL